VPDRLDITSHKGIYSVFFEDNAFSRLGADVPGDAHFIVDAKVARLYAEPLAPVLAGDRVLLIEASEKAKNLELFSGYVETLMDQGFNRNRRLVAVGGGVTQDIACFLAATMMRGVSWSLYPTTLLAQADSCIGSKSSINVGRTKNTMGTFTPPDTVHLDVAVLDTLDHTEVLSGVGEMLKVHVIDGPDSFDAMAADYERLFTDKAVMEQYVRRSLDIKKAYIEPDEFDRGIRNIFNYGHSFGHAVESATRFGIPHGIAVSLGMDMANTLSARLGFGTAAHAERMHRAIVKNYAAHLVPIPEEPFFAALAKDKKATNTGVRFILPNADGRLEIAEHPVDDAFKGLCREFFNEVGA